MNSDQLKYFLAVAKYLNFTEAAKEFYITQPAISRQITELEREMGAQLFVRNTRNVYLTKAGELFLEDAKKILSIEAGSRERIRLADSFHEMSLCIEYLLSPCEHFLPEVVNRFHQIYPQVEIKLVRNDAKGVSEAIEADEADIYFSVITDLKKTQNYAHQVIYEDFYCLVARADHPCLEQTPIDYEKVATEPFVMYDPKRAPLMSHQIMQVMRKMGITPRVVQYCGSLEEILVCIKAGLGISILPQRTQYGQAGKLTFVPLKAGTSDVGISMGWKHNTGNKAVEWFVNVINELIKERPELF
ncbi:DNA-binding transcriptional regulator, LysR family [Eubacterium oxidoreducens]|uniref:DNA-binding transcriptional regulator, LysR family n=2 Tax=Eubacterium oxidoreducens TaxID=1732 RepID=A0A1G6AB66_EUBOX|nr:DNA-binding transcriptional regulator, LysR family [Eubacterium oxidoreducens]